MVLASSPEMAQDASKTQGVPCFFRNEIVAHWWNQPPFSLLLTWFELRVQVVLQDQLRLEPEYIGSWHIFLPSEVNLQCVKFERFFWLWSCLCPMCCQCAWYLEPSRIQVATIRMHSLYHYDVDLFKSKFIGPPGATWPEWLLLIYVLRFFRIHDLPSGFANVLGCPAWFRLVQEPPYPLSRGDVGNTNVF